MAREPIKRQAHQSIESMADQLMRDRESGTKGRARLYNEVSQAQKAQALDTAIAQQMELLRRADDRGRVDLTNLAAVKRASEDYLESCRRSGTYPTMTALAPSLGYSRQGLYWYIANHDTDVTKYLDALRSSMAAIVQQAGLSKMADPAMSIFLLKNSVGMSDKLDVNATAVPASQEQEYSAEDIAQRYLTDSSEFLSKIENRYAQEDSDNGNTDL